MQLCHKFLEQLKVKFNEKTVANFFDTHSSHPSILSISDLLDEFNINNAAVRINKENFNQIETPFIAKTQSSEGDFCLITKIENENITYINELNETVTETLEQFYLKYSGVVLVAETNSNSIEPNYLTNKKKYSWQSFNIASLVVSIFILSFSAVALQNLSWQPVLLYFTKVTGLATSILLLIQSFDVNNPFINKLCSSSSGNGCSNILNSSAAKIFNGKLSWSEVGFFYFSSTFLLLALKPFQNTLTFIYIFSLLAIPYAFYSIIYQYKKMQWCKLCVSVQVVLLLEFAMAIFSLSNIQFSTSIISYLLIYSSLLITLILFWYFIKKFFVNNQNLIKLQKDVNQFKKDENIFNTLLQQQKTIKEIATEHKIILGNPNANFEITFVSNPYCNPCAEMHKKLKVLLNQERENLRLNIIYTVSSDEKELKNKVINNLISIYKSNGAIAVETAMEEWYSTSFKNSEQWFIKYQSKSNLSTTETMESHRIWCDESEVTHTPMLFINNYQYLSEYNLNDLKHFIHLATKQQNVSTVPHI